MRRLRKFLWWMIGIAIAVTALMCWLADKPIPTEITYGMSFNTVYARELGLDWKETYDALLAELGILHLRLAAHWPMIEPTRDVYNFEELDYQVAQAENYGATVVMAVGRRLPRWPECHVPKWAREQSWDDQKNELRQYIELVVLRYKDSPAITYWQVENEPFLTVFAYEHCGAFDEAFLAEEIALVKSLDPTRPVLVTDSGNLGTWADAYRLGDAFGTSVYVYFWNPELGQFKTLLPPWFYRAKEKVLTLWYGAKTTFLIELAAEPWLLAPVTEVPILTQYTRMDVEKFNAILTYAAETRYDTQYLWGAEWWYWLKLQGEPAMWERGKQVFKSDQATSSFPTTP
jgi:hypothetical protein